jgi:hypothetical protein
LKNTGRFEHSFTPSLVYLTFINTKVHQHETITSENINLVALEDIDLGIPGPMRFEMEGMLGVSVQSLPLKYAVMLTIPERYRGL